MEILSGLVRTVLFSVMVVELDVEAGCKDRINTTFPGFLRVCFSLILSTNPHVSNCLYLVSVSLTRYDYGLDYGGGGFFFS